MKILITGGCGFVGSNLCIFLKKKGFNIISLDNLNRVGSELNLRRLKKYKIKNIKINISDSKKISKLEKFDLIIDCCAEPSVEASRKSNEEARRVFDTNLVGTFNILQKCLSDKSKIIFLSSSRIYSITKLNNLVKKKNINRPLKIKKKIDLNFDQQPPLSLYGFTKLCSENLIKEFSYSNDLKYIINRCAVISGPWQMGRVDQGFVSLFCWSYLKKKKINFRGYGGNGYQIRDLLHCEDLNNLIFKQIININKIYNKTFTVGGGDENKISLLQLSQLLENKTGAKIKIHKNLNTSIYDIPYFVTCNKQVYRFYNWKPKKNVHDILNDVLNWQVKYKIQLEKIFK